MLSLLSAFLLSDLFFCLITSATTATLRTGPAAQSEQQKQTDPQEQQKQQQEEQQEQQNNHSGKAGTQLGKRLSLCSLGGGAAPSPHAPSSCV